MRTPPCSAFYLTWFLTPCSSALRRVKSLWLCISLNQSLLRTQYPSPYQVIIPPNPALSCSVIPCPAPSCHTPALLYFSCTVLPCILSLLHCASPSFSLSQHRVPTHSTPTLHMVQATRCPYCNTDSTDRTH